MSGPLHGRVRVGTSGYTLVCDFNALCELEAHFGDLDQIMPKIMSSRLSLNELRIIAAALLRHDYPRISHSDAGAVISDHYADFAALVVKAISLALPQADPVSADQEVKKKAKPRSAISGSMSKNA